MLAIASFVIHTRLVSPVSSVSVQRDSDSSHPAYKDPYGISSQRHGPGCFHSFLQHFDIRVVALDGHPISAASTLGQEERVLFDETQSVRSGYRLRQIQFCNRARLAVL